MILPSLTPRQTRTALNLLTAGMVISVAWALAGLTWRLAGHAGTGAIMVPSGRTAPGASPDIAPVLALSPFGKVTVSDATRPTALPLILQGVVAAQPAELSTAYIIVSGAPAAPFHIGDTVGGGTIQAILRDRVILSNAGQTEYLAFPDPNAPPPAEGANPSLPGGPPPSVTGTQPAPPPTNRAPNLLDGPPRGGTPAAPSTAAIMQRFNATPVDGGYRVGNAALPGLKAGDVLMSVNGTPLSDPSAAGAAFTAAQGSGSATIQVMRDGKPMTLTVPLK